MILDILIDDQKERYEIDAHGVLDFKIIWGDTIKSIKLMLIGRHGEIVGISLTDFDYFVPLQSIAYENAALAKDIAFFAKIMYEMVWQRHHVKAVTNE